MKSLFLLLFKILCLIALGLIGYKAYLVLSPQQETNTPNIEETNSSQTSIEETVTAPPSLKEEQRSVVSAPELPVIPEIIPEQKEAEPEQKEVESEQKKPSPLEKATLILVGKEASSSAEIKKDAELIEYACYHGEWKQYRYMLARSLTEAFQQSKSRLGRGNMRYDNLWKEPKFYTALIRWKALSALTDKVTSQTKSLSGSTNMITWLLNNDNALEEITLTLNDEDNKEQVFEFLSKIWLNEIFTYNEEEFNRGDTDDLETLIPKYFNLALACAVVFDNSLAYKNSSDGMTYVDGMFRYHWYRKKSEGGLLEANIHKASAKDLTFVVCSPVSTTELEWALRKYRSARRKNIGKAFSDVEYLMERAVSELNPYETYTLPEILKEGGICGDQTYFCVNVSRAAGIPAIGLSGLTNIGGHAWAAVKIDDDEWSTKIGRIAGVSRGTGRNPQTGKIVTEQDIWHWTETKVASRTNTIKIFRHLWIADFFAETDDALENNEAILIANIIGKEFPITWKRAYKLMLTKEEFIAAPTLPATLKVWKDFVKSLKHQFKKNPRMAASLAAVIEDKYIFPYSDIGYVRRELARLRLRDSKNAAEQTDIMSSSLKREADIILKLGKEDRDKALEDIHQLYTSSLRRYGGSLRGFKEMSQHYFNFMKNDDVRGKATVRSIERAYNRMIDTDSGDWFRKKEEVSIYTQIAKMYRQVGEERRAASIEKRMAREKKNAKRKAL